MLKCISSLFSIVVVLIIDRCLASEAAVSHLSIRMVSISGMVSKSGLQMELTMIVCHYYVVLC